MREPERTPQLEHVQEHEYFSLSPRRQERERESALSGMDNGWGSAPARGGEDCSRPKPLAKQMCESASESESG